MNNARKQANPAESDPAARIVGTLMRRHSTAAILFHHSVAKRLGLGPTDHQCLDLLREHGPMTGSRLAALTSLTTGAITGVVARLERAGFVRREPDPHDRRQQILSPAQDRIHDIHEVFAPIRKDMTVLLDSFNTRELEAIARFLSSSTDLVYRHRALLHGDTVTTPNHNI